MSIKIKLKHSAVNGKAPLPSDLDSGELALNTNAASPAAYIKDSAGNIVKLAGAGSASTPDASETVKGIAELATQAEVTTGTDDQRIVTPLKLATAVPAATEAKAGKVELATAAETTTGTDATRAVHPAGLKVELDKKANLAGPSLTGVPKAPTAAAGTNTTQLATTAFVHAATPAASATVKGLTQLADAAAITAGTAGRVVDAAQLSQMVKKSGDTMTGSLSVATQVQINADKPTSVAAVFASNVGTGHLFRTVFYKGSQQVRLEIIRESDGASIRSLEFGISNSQLALQGIDNIRFTNNGNLSVQHENITAPFTFRAGGSGAAPALWFAYNGSSWVGAAASDARLKTIHPKNLGAVEILNQLKPTYFEFQPNKSLALPEGKRWGFLAQELQTVLPTTVNEVQTPPPPGVCEEEACIEHKTTLVMANDAANQLCAVLTEALQETNAELKALQARVAILEGVRS